LIALALLGIFFGSAMQIVTGMFLICFSARMSEIAGSSKVSA